MNSSIRWICLFPNISAASVYFIFIIILSSFLLSLDLIFRVSRKSVPPMTCWRNALECIFGCQRWLLFALHTVYKRTTLQNGSVWVCECYIIAIFNAVPMKRIVCALERGRIVYKFIIKFDIENYFFLHPTETEWNVFPTWNVHLALMYLPDVCDAA